MEKKISVKGMHCQSCIESIEGKLGSLKGVKSASANLKDEIVFVDFDTKQINIEDIKSSIRKLGYSVDGVKEKRSSGIAQGVAYGLLPHIGCIAFIIGSVLGVTVLTQFFEPLMLSPYFFYGLIGLSVGFATLSSALYLRKNGLLSASGARRKWKYLSTMYGSTIAINLMLFFIIFPMMANISSAQTDVLSGMDLSSLRLQVDIPCSGHASLISNNIKRVQGVESVQFTLPNVFEVKYNSTASAQKILAIDVFKTYPATVLSESANLAPLSQVSVQQGSCGGSCGCTGSCGCGG